MALPDVVKVMFLIGLISIIESRSILLVDKSGKLAANRDLISLASRTGEQSRVVVAVGCKSFRKNKLLNSAFGTNFEVSNQLAAEGDTSPAVMDGSPGIIVLNCDGVTSEEEAKIAAISTEVADVVIVNVYRSDLGRCIAANISSLKAIFAQRLAMEKRKEDNLSEANPMPLLVVVHECEPDMDIEQITEAVRLEVESAWNELDSKKEFSKYISLSVSPIPHPRYSPDAYANASILLRDSATAVSTPSTTSTFAPRLKTSWAANQNAPSPPMAQSELVGLHAVETAFSEGVSEAEGSLGAWRMAAARGKVIGNYGVRANAMQQKVLENFDRNTFSSGGSLRSQRRAELLTLIEAGISGLFKQQCVILASNSMRIFKREMLALLNSDKLNEESEAALLRKTLFEFESQASELLPDCLPDLSFEEEYEEFEADLCDYLERFGESPAAQTRALSKVEKQVTKGARDEEKPGKKSRGGKRSITAGLGLVAFVRRQGLGNLQAFGGYRQGPHTVTVGYANDASTPEAMQEGEAPPLLRIQPKLNLDIDL